MRRCSNRTAVRLNAFSRAAGRDPIANALASDPERPNAEGTFHASFIIRIAMGTNPYEPV
jgi:hypothetical protein